MSASATLSSPDLPDHLPVDCHWLAGEGAGSWFHVSYFGNHFSVTRYSPEGKEECRGVFGLHSGHRPRLEEPLNIEHLSHCAQVTIVQDGAVSVLRRLTD